MLPGEPSQSAYLCDDVGTIELVQFLTCSKTDLELVQQNAKKNFINHLRCWNRNKELLSEKDFAPIEGIKLRKNFKRGITNEVLFIMRCLSFSFFLEIINCKLY